MLHVAAQGDSAPSLYLFKMLGIDINSVDIRGSTALHWACYSYSEIAIHYILAMGPDVNIQDVDGCTPLHLAIRRYTPGETTKPIRLLLMKGADSDLKDNNGKIPVEYTEDIEDEMDADNIREILTGKKRRSGDLLTGSKPIHLV
jgi:ankyrin repeat protein